ncbi:OLC1v1016662C1 [Oldenlandia corymbosa var. corymbosa]|uniref:OLC1v1016662C1 n=1 Tax=Oldenlandia corymbosa var. corymbosa TaxID=529605 RepID=A0AAV1E7M5_OLDCO|nr:OLC1v1016662C1 [Oldenlandia corymbosa var. corymbosa]
MTETVQIQAVIDLNNKASTSGLSNKEKEQIHVDVADHSLIQKLVKEKNQIEDGSNGGSLMNDSIDGKQTNQHGELISITTKNNFDKHGEENNNTEDNENSADEAEEVFMENVREVISKGLIEQMNKKNTCNDKEPSSTLKTPGSSKLSKEQIAQLIAKTSNDLV